MKAFKKTLICLMAAAMLVTGCGSNGKKATGNTKVENKIEKEANALTKTKGISPNLNLLTDGVWSASYSTNDGWYYLNTDYQLNDEENDLNKIMFVDYNKKQDKELCSKTGCKHNTNKCDSVLPKEATRSNQIFGQNGYLYLVSSEHDNEGAMSIQYYEDEENDKASTSSKFTPALYRMKLDGTEREKVMDFEKGVTFKETFLGDGESIYGVMAKIKGEKKDEKTYFSAKSKELVKIDPEKKTVKKILDLNADDELLSAYGRNLIVETMDYGRKVSTEEKQNDDNLYKNANKFVKLINIDNNSIKFVKKIKGDSANYKVGKNKIYFYYDKKKKIDAYDLSTGKISTIKTKRIFEVNNIITTVSGDDILVCLDVTKSVDAKDYYLLDTKTGKAKKGKLKNRYNYPIEIQAQSDDSLLVVNNYKNTTTYIPWKDVNQEEVGSEEYSVISKKDFLVNKDNYQKVKMVGMKKSEKSEVQNNKIKQSKSDNGKEVAPDNEKKTKQNTKEQNKQNVKEEGIEIMQN